MSLRGKHIAAQAPLAIALVVIGAVASLTNAALGRSSSSILMDNYRSVLAAQRMKEAIERIDNAVLFFLVGHRDDATAQAAANVPVFESELGVQKKNITEPGEREATQSLSAGWTRYHAAFDRFQSLSDRPSMQRLYFEALRPDFVAIRDDADRILAINQDAMVRKSDRAKQTAKFFDNVIFAVAASAFLAGLLASTTLTTRLLRPLSVLTLAARRLGDGDMGARARVDGKDELADLAREFNTMADRLARYQASSLGDLLQAQQQAQAAIDSFTDPIVVFESNGAVLSTNAAAERMLGIDVEIDNPLDRVPVLVREAIGRLRAEMLAGKGAQPLKGLEDAIRISSPDGEIGLLPRAAAIKTEEGGIVGCTVVLQDVTRLLRFDELKSNLVATVAHEFRTPLTSLRMAIHLCAEQAVGVLNEKQADLMQAARQDTERLQQIVDDLLDLSRIQAGRIELHTRALSVDSMLAAAIRPFTDAAAEKSITLSIEALPGQGAVRADPERIDLVFSNLLGNAIRHTPVHGAIAIRARAEPGKVRFEIRDTGPGVPAQHRQSIFEKFFRVPGTDTGGAGLGLFIAKEIVEAHGGTIGVEGYSQESRGQDSRGQDKSRSLGVDAHSRGGAAFWFDLPADDGTGI